MKKIFLTLSIFGGLALTSAQWSSTSMKGTKLKETKSKNFYSLNLDLIRSQLSNTQETGKNSKPTIIELPTLDGKTEQFEVYSLPVVEKTMAERYQLGSYVGTKVGDPTVYVRFSVSPYDLQSMMFRDGKYEFIEPLNQDRTVYGVFPKSEKQNGEKAFSCNTSESAKSQRQIDELSKGSNFSNSSTDFNKATDSKYRTYRLAVSVPGEYTQYFGGVSQAAAGINATMTRVNGVFEKDFGIHVNVLDLPQLIFANPATDPYSSGSQGASGAWNLQLQQTLTSTIGNDAYDLGHFFGRAGNVGMAGDVGNVCRNPANSNDNTSKGAAFSAARDGIPEGDRFDIDLVAHEMGHQFGADHTYSFLIQSSPNESAHMEPGSGSTIMSYAGITSVDVQSYRDSYYHIRSIEQVKAYINSQSCGTSTTIDNNAPVLEALPDKTIPKGTAFVLNANATDAENHPLTYNWEEYDLATTPVTNVTADYTNGAKFRSLPPSQQSYRYFPKLSQVLNGNLSNAADWESVSNVARTMNFKVVVRDNNPDVKQQQISAGSQKITVGNDGPFKVLTNKVYNNIASNIVWDVANTNTTTYNVSNVKIDYTTDSGQNWNVLKASTPNDGTEEIDFSSFNDGLDIIVRVSAIDNVFYAVGKVNISKVLACDGSAPINLSAVNIVQTGAEIRWDIVANATYKLRYKKLIDNVWTEVNNLTANDYVLSQLEINKSYDVQVAAVCSGTVGTYATLTFITSAFNYCSAGSTSPAGGKISNVTFAGINNNSSANVGYEDFSNVSGNVTAGQIYNFSASNNTGSNSSFDQVIVWIDLNQDGDFDDAGEKVLTTDVKTSPWNGTITIPSSITPGRTKMRVRLHAVNSTPNETPCGNSYFGQVEDYTLFVGQLAVSDVDKPVLKYYPNPVKDIFNIESDSKIESVKVFDITGKELISKVLNERKVQLNLAYLPSGVYIVRTIIDGKAETIKVIKK
ncbi:MAG: propanediol utilization protein [Chryseobacterium sp.]|nr:MAG: propanediol utilization protein [Chryseobacterium sp.]